MSHFWLKIVRNGKAKLIQVTKFYGNQLHCLFASSILARPIWQWINEQLALPSILI